MVSLKKIKDDAAREAKKAKKEADKVIKARNKIVPWFGPLPQAGKNAFRETNVSRNKRTQQMKHLYGAQSLIFDGQPFFVDVVDHQGKDHKYYRSKSAGIWADSDYILQAKVGNYNKKRPIKLQNMSKYSKGELDYLNNYLMKPLNRQGLGLSRKEAIKILARDKKHGLTF
jgi:hypothetical protein